MVKSATILIVEDDLLLADCYQKWLATGGYVTQVATDAQAALDAIDLQLPSAILLDMLLHGANGMQLLHTLQSHADLAHIPVVVCSNALPRKVPELAHYGVKVVLDKTDLTREKLVTAVSRSLL